MAKIRRHDDGALRATNGRWLAVAAVAALTAGCAGGEEGRPGTGWNPEDDAAGSTGGVMEDADGSTSVDAEPIGTSGSPEPEQHGVCEPFEERACLCADGVTESFQTCAPDGDGWGACECGDDGGTTGGPEPDDGTTGGPANPLEVCYPGADESWTTCFELVAMPDPPAEYQYPAAYQGNPNYRAPVAFLDLDAVPEDTALAPNFLLSEVAQRYKGKYAVVQPHAIASLQALRDAVGAIGVNSAYRSPAYNADIGGATYSRHMYGDAYDMDPLAVGLSTLENACVDRGGMLVEYDTHVHCDFRYDDVDEAFYGPGPMQAVAPEPGFSASLEQDGGVFWAPAEGFDEGEPMRRWSAYGPNDELLLQATGPVFAAPPKAVRVEVEVGRQVYRQDLVLR